MTFDSKMILEKFKKIIKAEKPKTIKNLRKLTKKPNTVLKKSLLNLIL